MREYTEAVTRFIFVQDVPSISDIIFIPGSGHEGHVLHAAALYHQGLAPLLLPSGLHGKYDASFTCDPSFPSEWAWMRSLLMDRGVPDGHILCEDRSTYTWENAQFSRAVVDRANLRVRRAILCCRAHHARRALFYYQTAFPDTKFYVCPSADPGISADDWFLTQSGRHTVLGEVRRLGDQILDIYDSAFQGQL